MSRIALLLFIALILSPMAAVCMGNDHKPHLSAAEVLKIADTNARSALRRDLSEFRRSPPRYSKEEKTWTVVYRNTAITAPSDVTIQISDVTRKASVSFGDAAK
jgi:hypothetical protein